MIFFTLSFNEALEQFITILNSGNVVVFTRLFIIAVIAPIAPPARGISFIHCVLGFLSLLYILRTVAQFSRSNP